MATTTVYQFEVWDQASRTYVRSQTWATQHAIEALDGRVVWDSMQKVDAAMLSEDGIVVQWPAAGSASPG
jgi:hypothetical protein